MYIEETLADIGGWRADRIREIKEMGVKVVNSLDELKEVIKQWECPEL